MTRTWPGWLTIIALPTLWLLLAGEDWPRWLVMWGLAAAVFAGCKVLSLAAVRRETPMGRLLAYLLAWPGLDANAFLHGETNERSGGGEWLGAFGKTAFGAILVWLAVWWMADAAPLLRGWAGMIGIVFVLHFGLFHVLSCFWRTQGRRAMPLQRWPIAARSLADFWGRRWNSAFRDITHAFVFRSLTPRIGATAALMMVFLASGLVHDLVISIPAQGGYGLPTLYFLLQGAGVLVERSRFGKRLGLAGGWRGWLFTMAVVATPLVILFHPPFVHRVIVPFLDALAR